MNVIKKIRQLKEIEDIELLKEALLRVNLEHASVVPDVTVAKKSENSGVKVVKSVKSVKSLKSLKTAVTAKDKRETRRLNEIKDIELLKEALLKLRFADEVVAKSKKTASRLKTSSKTGKKKQSKPILPSKKPKLSYMFIYEPYIKLKKLEQPLLTISYFTLYLIGEAELTGELPIDYDENRLVLQVVDPQTAFAYWEISLQERCRLRMGYGGHFVLRLHNIADFTKEEIWFPEDEGSCFMVLNKPESIYRAELGYYGSKRYSCVALSNTIYSPTDKVACKKVEPVAGDLKDMRDTFYVDSSVCSSDISSDVSSDVNDARDARDVQIDVQREVQRRDIQKNNQSEIQGDAFMTYYIDVETEIKKDSASENMIIKDTLGVNIKDGRMDLTLPGSRQK